MIEATRNQLTNINNEFQGKAKLVTLNVPDNFDYGNKELENILLEQYVQSE